MIDSAKYEYTSARLSDGRYEVRHNGALVGVAEDIVKAGELIEKLSSADREKEKNT